MEAWKITCGVGPFRNVDAQMFGRLLRGLAAHNILMQSADGTLLHAPVGEQIVNHYSFYTAFWASDEFKLVHGSTVLGSLPVSQPIPEKSLILFGGRRWRVVHVDDTAKVVEVVPAQGGRAPIFSGGGGRVHRRIHEEMRRLYQGAEMPAFLDQCAATLLREGREQFAKHQLSRTQVIPFDGDSILFLWAGDLVANTLLVQFQALGFTGLSFGAGLLIEDIEPTTLRARIAEIVATGAADPVVLADSVPNRIMDRYDSYLPPDLLSLNYASGELDVPQAWQVLDEILAGFDGGASGSPVSIVREA
jgi:ATP-dependent Lhr-like helicase